MNATGTASVLALALASCASFAACSPPPKAASAHGDRLPANGTPSDRSLAQLPSATLNRDDWNRVLAQRLAPTCDAQAGTRTADARKLEGADEVLDSWKEVHASKAKSRTGAGRKVSGTPEPTRLVSSVGMTCAQGASTLQVNGVRYPFDYAWVVSGEGKARTINGDLGAGEFAMIQAISFADQRIVFAKVYVPSDTNDDTDDTVVVTSLAGFLPANPPPPLVRVIDDPENPRFETFILSGDIGHPEGISLRVPDQNPMGRGRYARIAKFDVAL